MNLGPYQLGPNDTPENGIYTGDARVLAEAIPDESVDLFILDPPYGIGYASSRTTRLDGTPRTYGASFGKDVFNDGWLPDVARTLKPSGALYLFTRWDVLERWRMAILHTGLTIKQRIVWNKCHWKMGDLSYYGSQTEDVLFAIKSRDHILRWDKREGDLWSASSAYLPEGQYDHPTQKPESIIARMARNSSRPGDVVIDLHCGSGTVPAVARIMGRRWLACDIRPEYAALARERVRNTQPPLFVPQPEQLEMETMK